MNYYNTELEILPLKRVESELEDSLLNFADVDLNYDTSDEHAVERSIREMALIGSSIRPFDVSAGQQNLEISIHGEDDSIIVDNSVSSFKKYLVLGSCVLGGMILGGPVGGLIASKIAIGGITLVAAGSVTGGAIGANLGQHVLRNHI